jgi:hypothetical protein
VWEVAVHFVCAYVVEAELAFLLSIHGLPVLASGFQQSVGADDIGFNEVCWALYRPVYMTLSSKMHDGIRLGLGQYSIHLSAIADVYFFEAVTVIAADFSQRFKVARVGELVKVDHFISGVVNNVADDRGTYKASATGY